MRRLALAMSLIAASCASGPDSAHTSDPFRAGLLCGEVMAISYSGFRDGQHPDRGDGAIDPSREQILEDLRILDAHDFHLIRVYDSRGNTRDTLELIREHDLPIRVLLGVWLSAEFSNHEGCSWLLEPISEEDLAANVVANEAEVGRAIGLANEFDDLVVAVSVGNEVLVNWSDHMVPVDRVLGFVRQVQDAIEQPVTVADNDLWWAKDGAVVAAQVDFLGVHSYPVWEGAAIEDGMRLTRERVESVRRAHPGKPMCILEAGWATVASEFGDRAGEAQQVRYFTEMKAWGEATKTTIFFFEAFDEPWKGNPGNPLGAEKHWGVFDVHRQPKAVMR